MLPLFVALATLAPTGHVSDFAHLFRPETVANLEATLKDFDSTTGNEIAVVTIDTHGSDETIETYAVKLFEKWGIGKAKEDNGLLLLIAKDDHEMRIEVGYGLEGAVPDIEAGHIISDILVPAFEQGNYDEGVESATKRLMADIGRGTPQPEPRKPFPWGDVAYLIIILIIIFINIRRKRQGKSAFFPIFINRGGRGGGNSGGFGGFGGGSSGGGGASGRW